ncbi:HSPB1-associated protein 1 homolog isoform X2 [Chelonus insularis]|nr:HSPB1-associated protein 1 homolog isoform X2 [Chelonus insularis]
MMTMMEFLDIVQNNNINNEKWYYFDYKYMHEWFKLKPEILKAVDWKPFGFDKSGEDSTLWIGSKGAHTNCHQDSYGCNLIAQLHGKKEWLLFPPNSGDDLKQTRVPYEESTIYSKINFFCPSKDDENEVLKFIETPKLVILEPGDVLFVPKGWWHYVESLDTTLSVNIWLPLDSDDEARLKEAIVKLIMTRLGEGLPSAEDSDKFDSLQNSILLIKECIKQCHQLEKKNNEEIFKKKKANWNPSKLAQEYPLHINKLLSLSKEELKDFLINKRERFSSSNDINCSTIKAFSDKDDMYIVKSIVDTFCHSDVLDKIVKVLLTENQC